MKVKTDLRNSFFVAAAFCDAAADCDAAGDEVAAFDVAYIVPANDATAAADAADSVAAI